MAVAESVMLSGCVCVGVLFVRLHIICVCVGQMVGSGCYMVL